MNRILTIFFLLFIITTSCFTETEVILRVTEHPPYYYLENGIWSGVSVDLSNILLEEAGYSVAYKNLPWKRALLELKKGKIDMLTNLSVTEERKEYIHYIGPQMDETMLLIVSKDSEYSINNFDDIKNIPGKLGMQLGVFYGEGFHNKLETDEVFKSKFVIVPTGDSLIKLVNAKRLVGFISVDHEFYFKHKLYEEYKNLKDHKFIIHQNQTYFGFSKASYSEEEIMKFQEAYERVKKRSGFKKILDRYKSISEQ